MDLLHTESDLLNGNCSLDLDKTLLAPGFSPYKDASGHVPAGLSHDNYAWLGQYSDCLSLPGSQYCLADLRARVHLHPHNSSEHLIRLGLCAVQSCNESFLKNQIRRIVSGVLDVDWLTVLDASLHCQHPILLTKIFYVAVILISLLASFCLLGSLVAAVHLRRSSQRWSLVFAISDRGPRLISADGEESDTTSVHSTGQWNSAPGAAHLRRAYKKRPGHLAQLASCFSITHNLRSIFNCGAKHEEAVPVSSSIQNGRQDIPCIHGLKGISIALIITGNTMIALKQSGIVENPKVFPDFLASLACQPMRLGIYALETFFFISGLLASYNGRPEIEASEGRINVLKWLAQRYMRLTPVMLFCLLMWIGLKDHLSSGPIWYQQASNQSCLETWWSHLLFVQNFIPLEQAQSCYFVTWYVAVEMQLFLVTPLLLIAMYRWPRLSVAAILAAMTTSLVGCAAIIVFQRINVDLVALVAMGDIQAVNDYEKWIMTKPLIHTLPYFTGLLLGWKLFGTHELQSTRAFLWLVTLLVIFALAYSFYPFTESSQFITSEWYQALHLVLAIPLWSLCLAWVVSSCVIYSKDIANAVLSCKLWHPLSRMSYSVYMIHPFVLSLMVFTRERPIYVDAMLIIHDVISAIFISFLASVFVGLLVEIPLRNLMKFITTGTSPISIE